MIEILLTNGAVAFVDNEDFEVVSKHKWYLAGKGYVITNRGVTMHAFLLGKQKGKQIDHKDGNKLNNCRSNLRFCFASENHANTALQKNSSSGFKGVSFFKPIKKWRAYINKDRKQYSLGYFEDKIDAARAYNYAALKLFREFSVVNTI